LFSAEFLWYLVFFAEIQLSGKIPENIGKLLFYEKTHGARIRDGEGPRGAHTTWWRGPGQAAPGGGVAAPAIASTPPSAYIYPGLENIGDSVFFTDRVPLRRHHQKPRFRTRNSVLVACRDGDLEEIITIIIIDVSPSTMHDSPIHV
jgi:hypothetical protein